MKGTAQGHSITKQHLDSNHSFNLIPHALDHHSMMSFFKRIFKGQVKAQFYKQEHNLGGQSCKGKSGCGTPGGYIPVLSDQDFSGGPGNRTAGLILRVTVSPSVCFCPI